MRHLFILKVRVRCSRGRLRGRVRVRGRVRIRRHLDIYLYQRLGN